MAPQILLKQLYPGTTQSALFKGKDKEREKLCIILENLLLRMVRLERMKTLTAWNLSKQPRNGC